MKLMSISVVVVLTGLCPAVSGCDDDDDLVDGGAAGDADTDMDSDADTDADTDSDTDADTDVDSDGDSDECDPPMDVWDWGQACDPAAADCPVHTYCVWIAQLGKDRGYCAPICCQWQNKYCTDKFEGLESCALHNDQTDEWACMVYCGEQLDCPPELACRELESEPMGVCYPAADGDTDTDADTDSDTDTY